MALVYSHSAAAAALNHPRGVSNNKAASTRRKVVIMMSSSDNPISVNTKLQIRLPSTSRKKVFEDPSEGIVCFSDENGEITCEGIDEGPRFCHRSSLLPSSNQREPEIIDLLRACSIEMTQDFRIIN